MNKICGSYLIFDSKQSFFSNDNGVAKKIIAQIQTLRNASFDIDATFVIWNAFGKHYLSLKHILRTIFWLPFVNPSFDLSEDIRQYDFVYMRRTYMNSNFINFLKKLKKRNPSLKIIMELPSYPYDAELKNLQRYPFLIKERLARKNLLGLVDRIATLTDDKEIFGIPTIKFKNGYDFKSFKPRTPTPPPEADSTNASDADATGAASVAGALEATGTTGAVGIARPSGETAGEIRLCCVAIFSFWHGYERLLNGLADYYKTTPREQRRKIIIHFAGAGKELALYKQLTEKLGLGDHVIFHGRLDSEALRNLYNSVDIGMNSLGIYKAGGTVGMQLKTREYLAAGLPIVTGVHLDLHDYPEFRPYLLEFPNDPSPIDIQRIVDFYDRLNLASMEEASRIAQYLHETGEKYLGMGAAMKEVVDYIKESCGNTTHEITADQ